MLKAIGAKNYSKAEELYNNLVEVRSDNDNKNFFTAVYYSNLYKSGKSEGLIHLQNFVSDNPSYYYGISSLANCYMFYDDEDKAEKEVEKYLLASESDSLRKSLSLLLSRINLKQKKYDKAIDILYPFIDNVNSNSDDDNFELYETLGNIYRAQKKLNISCALYDIALNYKPTDTSLRFRAAYDYDEISKPSLSLYHYKAHLQVKHGEYVLNNMGIEYDKLKLPGKQIDAFKKAIEDVVIHWQVLM